MTINFELRDYHFTPEQLLERLTTIMPGFQEYWNIEGDLFLDKQGHFSLHGVLAVFSHFIREHHQDISDDQLQKTFDFVEECTLYDANSWAGIANAVYTCFLENLASEGELSRRIRRFMGSNSLKYFDEWDN